MTKTTRTVEDILTDLRNTKNRAAQNAGDFPLENRPGHAGAIRAAQDRLPGLVDELGSAAIPSRMVGAVVSGPSDVILAASTLLMEEGGVVLDAMELYRQISVPVMASMGRDKMFNTTQYSIMVDKMTEMAGEFGIDYFDSPKLVTKCCPSPESVTNHIRTLLEGSDNSKFNVGCLRKKMLDSLVSNVVISNLVPVLITNATEEDKTWLKPLFNRINSYTFSEDFEVTVPSITKIFSNKKKEQ